MSDQHDSHGSAIKTPKQLVLAIAAGFLVPIICIILLVELVGTDRKVGAGSQAQSEQAIAARISPVADQGFTPVVDSGQKQARTGEAVYSAVCAGCHGTGAAGAPKAGDAGAWSGRIAQGFDTLVKHAVTGIRAMPPKGGNPDLSDVEVGRAVAFLANQAGAKFKEP
jgi:cytochrome c5